MHAYLDIKMFKSNLTLNEVGKGYEVELMGREVPTI